MVSYRQRSGIEQVSDIKKVSNRHHFGAFMILLLGGEKGGTGKSTLATNMAVHLTRAGRDVLLLDADRQGTASNWTTERAEHQKLPQVVCVQRYGNLFQTVKDLARRYQEVIIDAGGRDSEELRSAMVIANKFYSPFRPSQGDLWTAEHLASLVTMARGLNPSLEVFAVLSLAPTNPRIQEIQEASALINPNAARVLPPERLPLVLGGR
jgi:chromosome partitioning protein